MRGWTFRILLSLILGAITAVAVAAAGARWSASIEDIESLSWPYPPTEVSVAEYAMLGEHRVSFKDGTMVARSDVRRFGFERREYYELPEAWFDERRGGGLSGGYRPQFIATTSGWPMIALGCYENFSQAAWDALTAPGAAPSSRTHRNYYYLSGGFDIIENLSETPPGFGPWPEERPIPFAPIWPGFLLDTLFYAAPWFGVFLGVTSAKRSIRVRRGRCPRCGYDLRGNFSAGCPECGWQRT